MDRRTFNKQRSCKGNVERAVIGECGRCWIKGGLPGQVIGDGTRLLSARDFVHIAQTRINALYSRSRTMRRRHGVSRQCRAGCGSIETTNHISQVCNSTKQFRIDRHDCIVSHLEARFLELGYHVEREPIIDIGQQTLKPDLVGHCGKTIIVCDI